jgi:thymidine phosphorylase
MDVKVGSGAFRPEHDQARDLAETIIEVARGNGLPTAALLTDMDRVMGRAAGNAVEVRESIDHLTGNGEPNPRMLEVTLALCEQLLRLKGIDADPRAALESGAAAEHFARMVAELGGPSDLLERPDDHLPRAPVTIEAHAERDGVVAGIDVRAVGLAIIDLGGGRRREDEAIDHAVGLTQISAPGERVGPHGQPLALVHARDENAAAHAADAIRAAFSVGDRVLDENPAVLEVVT